MELLQIHEYFFCTHLHNILCFLLFQTYFDVPAQEVRWNKAIHFVL